MSVKSCVCVFLIISTQTNTNNFFLQGIIRYIMYKNSWFIFNYWAWKYSFTQLKCIQLSTLQNTTFKCEQKHSSCFAEQNSSSPCPPPSNLSLPNAEHTLIPLFFNTYFNIILPSISSSPKRAISFTLIYQLSLHVSKIFKIPRRQMRL